MSGEAERETEREAVDLDRRRFFRSFGRSAVEAAGQVAGAADILRRGTLAAAGGMLEAAREASPTAPGAVGASQQARIPGEVAAYRSPYRLVEDALILVDQRALPEKIVELTCRDGRDVARAIASGAVGGAPLLGQLAAYGLAITAKRLRDRRAGAVRVALESNATLLRAAAPSARPVAAALGRMTARKQALGDAADPEVLADALRAEADAIATEAMSDHAALARHGAAALPRLEGRPLDLLVHGELGAMGGGLVGTGLAIAQLLQAEERPVHVWITEARPTLEGARVAAWELRQAGIAHTVIADSSVAWLFRRQAPDAALLGASWVTCRGDAAVGTGGAAVAVLAATIPEPPVPVLLCAPLSTFDPDTADPGAIPDEQRAIRAFADDSPGPASAGPPRMSPSSAARTPAVDIVEARWLTAILTEEGVLPPPFESTLAAGAASRRQRLGPRVT